MIDADLTPIHSLPTGLCEDVSGEATSLLGRMARGDAGGLKDLHDRWAAALLGIAIRMLGERHAAEKALRDAFVVMWRRSPEFDPHKLPPFVWAYGILRHICANRLRKARHAAERESPVSGRIPSAAEDPRIMPPEDWRRVRNAWESLTTEERDAMERAVFLQYALARPEASENPPGSVKQRLRRAVEKLRNDLSRYEL